MSVPTPEYILGVEFAIDIVALEQQKIREAVDEHNAEMSALECEHERLEQQKVKLAKEVARYVKSTEPTAAKV